MVASGMDILNTMITTDITVIVIQLLYPAAPNITIHRAVAIMMLWD